MKIQKRNYRTEKRKKYERKYYKKHREHIRKKHKKYCTEHKDEAIMRDNNITLPKGGYAKMFKDQKGRCKLCGKKETVRTKNGKIMALQTDHNPRTKKVRGLLCNQCNVSLVGYVEQIMKINNTEFIKISRYIGTKKILTKIDNSINSNLMCLHPTKLKSKIRKTIWHKYWPHITEKQRLILMKKQNSRCKLCKRKTSLEIDHNHRNDIVRGLLCGICNKKVSYIEKIINLSDLRLNKILKYIGLKLIINRIKKIYQ